MMRSLHKFEPGSKMRAQTIPAFDFCVCSRHKDSPIHRTMTDRVKSDAMAQFTGDNADAEMVANLIRFREYVAGKKVRIIVEHRDQPFGHSKTSLKGNVETVSDAGWNISGWYLMLKGRRCSIGIHEVEFL